MNATLEPEAPIDVTSQGLALVDAFMADISHQNLVDQGRCIDFALDVRRIFTKEGSQA